MPVYNCPLTDKSTRDCMQALFSPFLTPRESTTANNNNNNNGSPLPQMPPAASISSPILQSPSTSSSTSTPTSQRPISDTKTEEEQQQQPLSINEHQNGAMDESAQGKQEENADDVDHHLHGENGMYSCVGVECHQV